MFRWNCIWPVFMLAICSPAEPWKRDSSSRLMAFGIIRLGAQRSVGTSSRPIIRGSFQVTCVGEGVVLVRVVVLVKERIGIGVGMELNDGAGRGGAERSKAGWRSDRAHEAWAGVAAQERRGGVWLMWNDICGSRYGLVLTFAWTFP